MKRPISVRSIALFGIGVLLSVSCVSTKSTAINPANKRFPISPDKVVLYTTAEKVPGRYEEIAFLNTRADSIWRSEAAMLSSIRDEAAKLGANGVILDATSEPSTGAKVASFFLFGFDVAGRKNKAVAIYVFPPEEQKK